MQGNFSITSYQETRQLNYTHYLLDSKRLNWYFGATNDSSKPIEALEELIFVCFMHI